MTANQQSSGKIKVTFHQAIGMILPYVKSKIVEQIKSVAVIICYLILFQTVVLRIAIAEAAVIAVGLALVIAGLAFFMEGLFIGIMPLGEIIGVKLPQKSKVPVILGFAFILGIGVTFAEPAIGVLKAAGYAVKPWDAPLLFLILNRYSGALVAAVAIGVGIAVVCGMLRFIYGWSLKWFLWILFPIVLGLSVAAFFDPNWLYLTGVAWDCGAVTTGPVTVPLVLALGIGISRIVGGGSGAGAGFGVVTLASTWPIIVVMLLGLPFLGKVPKPTDETSFFNAANRPKAEYVFGSREAMIGYAFRNASAAAQIEAFDGNEEAMSDYLRKLAKDQSLQQKLFGSTPDAFYRWAVESATDNQRLAIFGSPDAVKEGVKKYGGMRQAPIKAGDVILRNYIMAAQAILSLCLFLFIVFLIFIREKLPRSDEILLGIFFGVIGMGLFNIGIELGLAKLGNQIGGKVPASFRAVELSDEKWMISGFDPEIVQTAVTLTGEKQRFFYANIRGHYTTIPYDPSRYDPSTQQYTYIPTKGPLYGAENGFWGLLVVILFAFVLGYGATLAEPALNALGITVEDLTVGTFKKAALMQAVALGVGIGIAFGVAKIIWNWPLIWLLMPPYIALLIINAFSTEDFVNIGWDSAGVTTGPITVPLVLAMGLGIGGQMGVVEGFGILALASVWPILCVLTMGLIVTYSRRKLLQESTQTGKEGA